MADEENKEMYKETPPHSPLEEMLSEETLRDTTPKEEIPLESINDTEVCIKVEAGRVKMSLNELMQLTSGSQLQLDSIPEAVKLTVNGKVIAEGELMKVGEMLGVRIKKMKR